MPFSRLDFDGVCVCVCDVELSSLYLEGALEACLTVIFLSLPSKIYKDSI